MMIWLPSSGLLRKKTERFAREPATRLAVRIGTSLNRETTADLLTEPS